MEKVFSDIERTCICLTYIFPFNFCLLTFWCCCPFLFLSVAVVPLGSFLVLFPFRFFLVLLSLQILCWCCCPFILLSVATLSLSYFLVLLSFQVLNYCCYPFKFLLNSILFYRVELSPFYILYVCQNICFSFFKRRLQDR